MEQTKYERTKVIKAQIANLIEEIDKLQKEFDEL